MTYEISAVSQDPDFSSFNAAPVGGCIGAVNEGLAVSKPLSATAAREIQQALVHYHVLFFHGLTLTPAQATDWNRT
jgi:alpha-ketoglutarate-dependent taurine dioxygenase